MPGEPAIPTRRRPKSTDPRGHTRVGRADGTAVRPAGARPGVAPDPVDCRSVPVPRRLSFGSRTPPAGPRVDGATSSIPPSEATASGQPATETSIPRRTRAPPAARDAWPLPATSRTRNVQRQIGSKRRGTIPRPVPSSRGSGPIGPKREFETCELTSNSGRGARRPRNRRRGRGERRTARGSPRDGTPPAAVAAGSTKRHTGATRRRTTGGSA